MLKIDCQQEKSLEGLKFYRGSKDFQFSIPSAFFKIENTPINNSNRYDFIRQFINLKNRLQFEFFILTPDKCQVVPEYIWLHCNEYDTQLHFL